MEKGLGGRTIVLGVTGSIAAYKAAHLARLLVKEGAEVRVVLTEAGARFITPQTFAPLVNGLVYTDMFEDTPPARPAHLAIPQGADLIVIAPASADFIARLAAGIADDLLGAVCLAASCPMVVAPAMHHQMWANPIVQANVARLASFGVTIVGPEPGELASGDEGRGRMTEPEALLEVVRSILEERRVV